MRLIVCVRVSVCTCVCVCACARVCVCRCCAALGNSVSEALFFCAGASLIQKTRKALAGTSGTAGVPRS